MMRAAPPVLLLLVVACSSSTPETTRPADGGAGLNDGAAISDAGMEAAAPLQLDGMGCAIDPGAQSRFPATSATDPVGDPRTFTLDDALAGFPVVETKRAIVAILTTGSSSIRCELNDRDAPMTTANFIGLARGTRPFRTAGGSWTLGRYYDGLTWHRVVPNFVIQGGDPLADRTGGPGYTLSAENQISQTLGSMGMASDTTINGSQFYIVVGTPPAAQYNVFGLCSTQVAIEVSMVPRDAMDKPLTPVPITRVDIRRCPRT